MIVRKVIAKAPTEVEQIEDIRLISNKLMKNSVN